MYVTEYWQKCQNFLTEKKTHSIAECNAGYYGNAGTSCTLCPGNTIKAEQGATANCDVECAESSDPNDEHRACGNNHNNFLC